MSKELATQNTSRYVQALYNINAGSSSLDGRDILKLTAEGMWTFGQDNAEVDEQEDVFVINPESFREGYVAFDDKNNLAVTLDDKDADFLWQIGSAPAIEDHEEDNPLDQPKSSRAPRIEYRHQLAIDLVCIEGPNKGAQLVYKCTSQGGRKMLGKLAGEIARRKERGDEDYVPAVSLWADDYWSRKWGRTIWNPQAEILDWYTMEDDVLKDTAPKEERKSEKRDGKRAAAKPARADRKSARDEAVEEDAPRSRGRRDERGGEVEARTTGPSRRTSKAQELAVEEPEYEEEDEAEDDAAEKRERENLDRVASQRERRGRGRPEPESRGKRPARGDDRRLTRPTREAEAEEEEDRGRGRRAAGGRGRR